jgi:hypothetical protein
VDKKETYLYGVLLALSREQLAAMEKAERRQLGVWGRYRAAARGDTMAKFIVKIMEHKSRDGLKDPLDPIKAIEAVSVDALERAPFDFKVAGLSPGNA